MIEPTGEMVQEIYSRIDFVNHGDDGIREGLAAVLDLLADDVRTVLAQHTTHTHYLAGPWGDTGAGCPQCAARKRLEALFINQDGRS